MFDFWLFALLFAFSLILLLALLDYVLIKYGLRIYKVGILNYSETDLWKKMFKAIKQEKN